MASKSLKLFLIFGTLAGMVVASGCPMGSGQPGGGGGAARSLFAGPSGDTPLSGASAAGPSAVGGSGDGGAGDEGPGDLSGAGDAPGTTSDTPITVVGSPLGSSQGPHCAPQGIRIYFDDAATAITGQTDELGRREILVKTHVYVQHLSDPPEPLSETYVNFVNPDNPEEWYGHSNPYAGCLFAKVYAPPEAAGRVIRLTTSLLVCAADFPNVSSGATEASAFMAFRLGPSIAVGNLDVTLPSETVEKTLEDCGGGWTVGDHFRQDAVFNDMVMNRIERSQDKSSDAPETQPSWKDSVMKSRF